MSLDISLYADQPGTTGSGIFIREDGQMKELSRAEWDERFPDREPVLAASEEHPPVFEGNITHNLGQMADAANLYIYVWRPDEIGFDTAGQLVQPLRAGLARLKSDAAFFTRLNPENGWGDYEGLVGFIERYLKACEEHPAAIVKVSR
jgi:hypothetical protein